LWRQISLQNLQQSRSKDGRPLNETENVFRPFAFRSTIPRIIEHTQILCVGALVANTKCGIIFCGLALKCVNWKSKKRTPIWKTLGASLTATCVCATRFCMTKNISLDNFYLQNVLCDKCRQTFDIFCLRKLFRQSRESLCFQTTGVVKTT
jgi:hypothetical protein